MLVFVRCDSVIVCLEAFDVKLRYDMKQASTWRFLLLCDEHGEWRISVKLTSAFFISSSDMLTWSPDSHASGSCQQTWVQLGGC